MKIKTKDQLKAFLQTPGETDIIHVNKGMNTITWSPATGRFGELNIKGEVAEIDKELYKNVPNL